MPSVRALHDDPQALHPLRNDLSAVGLTVLSEVDDRSKLVQAVVRGAPYAVADRVQGAPTLAIHSITHRSMASWLRWAEQV